MKMMALLLMAIGLISSCSTEENPEAVQEELEVFDLNGDIEAMSTVEDQLQMLRQLTMRYHSFEQAEKDGYAEESMFNPSPWVPNMGFHYTKESLLFDEEINLDEPEILIYVPNEKGKLKLVGIEYAIPLFMSPEAPEGFIGDDDQWSVNPHIAGGAWTLHVWMPLDNPDGIFTKDNPRVPVENPMQ